MDELLTYQRATLRGLVQIDKSHTPYGNFQLKFIKIVERLDETNRRIEETFRLWELVITPAGGIIPSHAYSRHVFANEQVIYMMRRAADELVSLIWCLSEHERAGACPDVIEVDSLACVLKPAKTQNAMNIYQPHLGLLEVLNEVANAFKHSFINSDITLFGSEEPCVHALSLKRNRLSAVPQFYNVGLTPLVEQYSAFYRTCLKWLRTYSEQNRGQ